MDWHYRNLANLDQDERDLHFAKSHREGPVKVLEAFTYLGPTLPTFSVQDLPGSQLKDWLNEGPPTIHGDRPVTGLRLVLTSRYTDSTIGNRVLNELPFSRETYRLLCNALGLHHSLAKTIIRGKCSFSSFCSSSGMPGQLTGYHLRTDANIGGDTLLSASITNESKMVSALIHGLNATDITLLVEWLQLLMPDIFHCLLLPSLVMDLIRIKHSKMIQRNSEQVVQISNAARQYDVDENPLAAAPSHIGFYNQKTRDVLQLHQDTGDLSLALSQTRVQLSKLIKLATDGLAGISTEKSSYVEGLLNRLQEILETHDHLERVCAQVKDDCTILMGAIYNLIAQMQNEVNLEIANDSKKISAAAKRDSSAMKAIAILTMFLLPGTFVASFFAMPLLNWSAGFSESQQNSMGVINPRFPIYWAFTLPLTAAVLVVYVVWDWWADRHEKRLAASKDRELRILKASSAGLGAVELNDLGDNDQRGTR